MDQANLSRRESIKRTIAASAGGLLGDPLPGQGWVSAADTAAERPNLITLENAKTGSLDWQLTRVRTDRIGGIRNPWIEGYCSRQSVGAGESIDIFVSTDPIARFQIEIFRTGYYGGRGSQIGQNDRPTRWIDSADAKAGRETAPRVPVETSCDGCDSK